jgi:hypothetical protein
LVGGSSAPSRAARTAKTTAGAAQTGAPSDTKSAFEETKGAEAAGAVLIGGVALIFRPIRLGAQRCHR